MITPHSRTLKKPREGRRIGIVGDTYRLLVGGEETDGRYAMFEAIVVPGGGPPPHRHSREEEGFYVLEGEITFQDGDERTRAGAGTFVNMPVGSLHAFKNEGDTQARMLITIAPAGLEKMFLEVGQPIAEGEDTAPPPTDADVEKLVKACARYGIEIKMAHE